jgi:hypothetical protein
MEKNEHLTKPNKLKTVMNQLFDLSLQGRLPSGYNNLSSIISN